MSDYSTFVAQKLRHRESSGIDDAMLDARALFPHQDALVRWALRKGKAAIFADTGLGKTRMQLAWADAVHRATGGQVLILAPLAVAAQTVQEGLTMGLNVTHARDQSGMGTGISVTNYERVQRFETRAVAGIVLDESSRIKHDDAKTFSFLCESFDGVRFKLCATATPAPNDWTELGTHAAFLDVCSQSEMLAEFFVHDGGETQVWRLKGHARQSFWRWVAGWGAMIRSPEDLGMDASRYELPPLHVEQVTVGTDARPVEGELFAREAQTLSERRQAKRDSLVHRVRACADRVNRSDAPWVVWTELNAEGDAATAAIPDAVEIRGSDRAEIKEQRLLDFAAGKIRVLVSKPSIAGWGLNWQHCRNIAFLGATDSFESYYQSVRRCWRFGQTQPVHVYLFASEIEGAVLRNLQRKESEAVAMFAALSAETSSAVRDEVMGQRRQSNPYHPARAMALPLWMESVSEVAA